MKAVIYVRVSTEKQASHGLSLDTQIINCQRYADVHDYEVIDVVVDAQTAKNTRRPGLQRILKMATAKKIQHVIVWNIDRLTRSLEDSIMLTSMFLKKKVTLHEAEHNKPRVVNTSQQKLMDRVEMAFKEYQREDIGDKTRTILQGKKEQGLRYSGRSPFGYRFTPDGKIEPDDHEQGIIERIMSLKAEGFTIRAIQARLHADGVVNRKNRPIGRTEIWNITKKAA